MFWSRWHKWSTQAGGLAVWCFNFSMPFLMRKHHFIDNSGEERSPHFIGYLSEKALFMGWIWKKVFYLCSKLCWRLADTALLYGVMCYTCRLSSVTLCYLLCIVVCLPIILFNCRKFQYSIRALIVTNPVFVLSFNWARNNWVNLVTCLS